MRMIIAALVSFCLLECACSRKSVVHEESSAVMNEMVSVSDTVAFSGRSYNTLTGDEVNKTYVTIQEDYDSIGRIRQRTIKSETYNRERRCISRRDTVSGYKKGIQTVATVSKEETNKVEQCPAVNKVKSSGLPPIYAVLLVLGIGCLLYLYIRNRVKGK